ncbi:MAG: cellulose-binding protein [Microcoleaceae cyanobacterium]
MIAFLGLNLQRYFKNSVLYLSLISFGFALAIFLNQVNLPSPNQLQLPQAKAAPPTRQLGTNLSGIADYSTQMPFVDAFKSSRRWITQCSKDRDPNCGESWSTNEFDQLDLDEWGWVKSLPDPEDSPEYTQVVTLMYRGVDPYPGGTYIVLYDGVGTLEYDFDADKDQTASTPGRDVLQVDPSDRGILLKITETDPNKTGNYIRNIRVIPAEYEQNYQSVLFNPTFIEKTKPYQALRFMDWMQTNHSKQSKWENRPKIQKASYSYGGGVPIEIMVELSNRLQVDPWFNMPHKATDEYMRNFAELIKETLDPNLIAYVEYSNEVWNPQFEQFNWVKDNGPLSGEGNPFQPYGVRTAQMCEIWKDVFAGETQRIQCVISTQTANRWVAKQVLDCDRWSKAPCYQHGVDVFAISSYFSGKLGQPKHEKTIESWIDDPNIDEFKQGITQLKDGSVLDTESNVSGLAEKFQHYTELAKSKGLKLVIYEGGNHVVGVKGVQNNEKLTEYFIELNRRPEFYDLYEDMFEAWQDPEGVRTVFMHFSDITRSTKWGSWGALEHVTQDHSPKYDALKDALN